MDTKIKKQTNITKTTEQQKPTWIPKDKINLASICEPIYKMASMLADEMIIKEYENEIDITGRLGCESYFTKNKCYRSTDGKEYNGTMPENYENTISYAARCRRKGRINTTSIKKQNGCINCEITFGTCSRNDCFLTQNCNYCYDTIAKYIKFLRTYNPEEEIRQREEYKKNPYPTYEELEPFGLILSDTTLQKIKINSATLELGKALIDEGLILPTILLTDNSRIEKKNLHFTIYYPMLIIDMLQKKALTIKNFRHEIKKLEQKGTFRETMSQGRIDREIPFDNNSIIEYFNKAFTGKEEISSYFVATTVFCYTTLQQGKFKEIYDKAKKEEKQSFETANKYLTDSDKAIASQKKSFYGMLIAKDRDTIPDIAKTISRMLLKQNPDMMPIINHESITEFLESFSSNQNIIGEANNFGITHINPLHKNIIYVIDNTDELFYETRHIKKSTDNRSRIYRKAIEFLNRYPDGYYILIVCDKEEKEKFLKFNEVFPYTFGKSIINIPDETPDSAWEKFKEKKTPITEKEFKTYYRENTDNTPFKNDTLIRYLGQHAESFGTLPETLTRNQNNIKKMIDEMVGLESVKTQIQKLEKYMHFTTKAKKENLNLPPINRHMVFKGNPGTGKTSIARIIARILYDAGLAKKDKLIECKASDLIGEYVGQTGPKTAAKIEEAYDGVLFIDEAYALGLGGTSSFGEEAIATLCKMMEDNKDKLTIIFAGYTKEMDELINKNPGLKSRIGYTFEFPDYTEEELMEIFQKKMKKAGFHVDKKATEKIKKNIRENIKRENFGNGRFIDKMIQDTIIEHAQSYDDKTIREIIEKDVPDEGTIHNYKEKEKSIGFK